MKPETKKDVEFLKRELSRQFLGHFVKYVNPDYSFGALQGEKPIHMQIINLLESIERWENKRVMIFCPPRLGKSELVSKMFPAWYLWKHPDKNVVCCSYGADLANQFGRQARQIVMQPEYYSIFPESRLSDDKKEWGNWEMKQWWWYYSVWVWWSLTGRWFNVGIIDDPVKNREEAESEVYREKVKERYTSTFFTRKMDANASIIVMCTRWHEDDLAWRLLERAEQTGEEWTVLKIQAEDPQHNVIERNLKWWDEEFWRKEKLAVWSYDWASLYLQEPYDEGSWTFTKEMFKYYKYRQVFDNTWAYINKMKVYSYIDPAISTKQSADCSAIVTVWQDENNNIYILDIFNERVEPDDLIENLFRIVLQFKVEKVWVEVVQFQKMLVGEIRKQMKIRDHFFNLEEVRPMGEKEARIKAILAPRMSNHSILHREEMRELEAQLLKFPNGKHDDIIDALAWVVNILKIQPKKKPERERIRYYTDPLTGQKKVMGTGALVK